MPPVNPASLNTNWLFLGKRKKIAKKGNSSRFFTHPMKRRLRSEGRKYFQSTNRSMLTHTWKSSEFTHFWCNIFVTVNLWKPHYVYIWRIASQGKQIKCSVASPFAPKLEDNFLWNVVSTAELVTHRAWIAWVWPVVDLFATEGVCKHDVERNLFDLCYCQACFGRVPRMNERVKIGKVSIPKELHRTKYSHNEPLVFYLQKIIFMLLWKI